MKTLEVFIHTTTTSFIEQEQLNDRYHAGYFQHKGHNPRDQHKHSITQAGSPPFIYRQHSGNKIDI